MLRTVGSVLTAGLLAGCSGAVGSNSPSEGAPSSPSSLQASEPASLAPTADPSMSMVYVNEGQGWSIGVPAGWNVGPENATGAVVGGVDGFVEILLAPATGLTLEQREAQRVAEVSTWPGVGEIESDVVSLPAGEAVRLVFETGLAPNAPPAWFIFYVFEEGDTQYVMSVRGPKDNDELPAVAETLAESFAILD